MMPKTHHVLIGLALAAAAWYVWRHGIPGLMAAPGGA